MKDGAGGVRGNRQGSEGLVMERRERGARRMAARSRFASLALGLLLVTVLVCSVCAAAPGPMLARFLDGPMAGVEEVVFAVRGLGGDGHWYANFGHRSDNPNARNYGPPGGQLCRLNLRTGQVRVLLDDPKGGVRDPQIHYDAGKVLFSYRRGDSRHYHLFEMNLDGTGLRQLTDGPFDELEAIYLPDGDLLFCSSSCNRWVQCWFTQVAVLYRSDADGRNMRLVSANIEHDNTPWMLPDGRVLYMRWEYVDRSRVRFHHLWTINPDGTGQMTYYGNMHPGTVMLDAKPIPGTEKVVASFGPGHGRKEHAGHVTVVDPNRGPDARRFARRISRESDWRDPYAFSEDCFMVARGRSLYVMDGQGQTEAFYGLPVSAARMEVHEPRPVRSRKREPIIAPRVDWAQPTGRLILADVTHGRSMEGVKPGQIKKLLVLETLPKPVNFSGTMEPISLGGTFTLPRVLGTVPVEPDGSAHIEVPALRPLFFVALDSDDLSVKRMQSFVSVMPGETTGCSGCHENRTDTAHFKPTLLALKRPPSRITPINGVPGIFDFPRDIQPILNSHCVRCHNYEQYKGNIALTGDRGPQYSHAYVTLMSRGQVSHGRDADGNIAPRKIGTCASPLMTKVLQRHNGVKLSPHEVTMIRLWIESGAPYPGTYAALGSGMVGMRLDAGVLDKRCGSCHAVKDKRRGPKFRTHPDLLANLTRPEKSIVLLAPLAKKAGGLGLCCHKANRGEKPKPADVFASRRDSDYQKLLAGITRAKADLDRRKRFDMPGFRPNEHYIREMQRYGTLPADLAAADPIDPYATDEKYWQSFWYVPKRQ